MSITTSHARKPWIAASLSLLCPGLGQIYCGQAGRGLVMFCGTLSLGPLIFLTAIYSYWTPVLIAFFGTLVATITLLIWSVRDARAMARRLAGVDFQLQDFNRPLIYVLMVACSVPSALGLALFLRATVLEAFVIPSSSMVPTLIPGDRVLVTKLGLDSATFQRGDVVVFRNPINRKQKFVKRIIGLPGETVEIRDGTVIIDGQPLEKTPAPTDGNDEKEPKQEKGRTFIERAGTSQYQIRLDNPDVPIEVAPVKVAADAYFVLGDHRDMSLDSREVGSVPHGLMVGIVRCIYSPARSWRRFGPPK